MPKSFDLVAEFAEFCAENRISLRDPQAIEMFITSKRENITGALSNNARLHGQRIQAMFEALLLSLGDHILVKVEDSGQVYPENRFKVPDFRVVLSDGTQWLIEVKNVYEKDALQQKRRLMNSDYRKKLEAYASATGGQLKLAVFWARWAIWTLVSPERLIDGNGNLNLDMETAIYKNELSRLGDRMIGTRPPLRLRLTADPKRTSAIAPDGTVEFTIARAQLYCREDEILDPVEQQIAWIFMQYGDWETISTPQLQGDQLKEVECLCQPRERANGQLDFEMIGTLSRIYTSYYAEQTLENREIIQLQAKPRPQWFAPLVKSDYNSKALPLWLIEAKPNFTENSNVTND